jgi:hypothetical protein
MIKTWLSSWVQEIQLAAPRTVTPEDILSDAAIYLERLHAQARVFFSGYLDRIEGDFKNKGNSFLFKKGKFAKRCHPRNNQGP